MKLPDLKEWFNKQDLPKELQLNKWTKINNTKEAVNSLINLLEKRSGNKGYLPYYKLLTEIKEKLECQKQTTSL